MDKLWTYEHRVDGGLQLFQGDEARWFEELMDRHTRYTFTETVRIRPGLGETEQFERTIEVLTTVSWHRLFNLMVMNRLAAVNGYFTSLSQQPDKSRGRIAMAATNSLRGAARRRGGLWVPACPYTDAHKPRLWAVAPRGWLLVEPPSRDYTTPVEDRDGNPITDTGG